jgi:transposase, IS30 family
MPKKKRKKSRFHHLNKVDRDEVEILLKKGYTQKEIAETLGVNASTISRERKRKRKNGVYKADSAQHKANVKRSNSKYCGMKIERNPKVKRYIIKQLKKKRSPDEIAGRMKLEKITPRISTNAIYKWIYSSYGQAYCKYLCTKRYKNRKRKPKTKREMIPNRISLEKRPQNGEHAEGDLFVSPIKTGVQRSGAIICLPTSKLLIGRMIENKKPDTMVQAVKEIILEAKFDDLTLDNGLENRYHEQFGIDTYFADAYSPWQKPHVENSIGLLRRWFIPKGTNLNDVSEEYLQTQINVINHKFRKSLGYRSAFEVSLQQKFIQKIPALRRV